MRIYDVIETGDYIYIIMEYAVGGELFDYIVANKRVKEKEARSFFRMVLSAIDYCHKVWRGCGRLDLSPSLTLSYSLIPVHACSHACLHTSGRMPSFTAT